MPRLLAAVLLLLAACGGVRGFDGTFTGTYQGMPVTLVLEAEGQRASGTMEWGGVEAVVSGAIDGNRIKGTVRQPQMGVEVPFEATLDRDTIDWTYTYVAAGQKVPLTLTRTAARVEKAPIDPQLVGRWQGLVLNADGTFERGTERGRWKCEGQVLSSRVAGAGWVAWGRYVLSGDELVVYAADGTKQVWKRG